MFVADKVLKSENLDTFNFKVGRNAVSMKEEKSSHI